MALATLALAALAVFCLRSQEPVSELLRAASRDDLAAARLIVAQDPGQVHARLRGRTCLHIAAMQDSREMVKLLVKAGADPNAGDDHGDTPLHLAVFAARGAAARTLLELGAEANARNHQGLTPLHVGAWVGMTSNMLLFCLRGGGDVRLADGQGRSFQELAERHNPALYKVYLQLARPAGAS